jgi:hypothetical protein
MTFLAWLQNKTNLNFPGEITPDTHNYCSVQYKHDETIGFSQPLPLFALKWADLNFS